jgi:hypothetical protein
VDGSVHAAAASSGVSSLCQSQPYVLSPNCIAILYVVTRSVKPRPMMGATSATLRDIFGSYGYDIQ